MLLHTASGRATSIRKAAINNASRPCSSRRVGVTSKPSTTNMLACANQASPSITRNTCSVAWLRRLPTKMPAR